MIKTEISEIKKLFNKDTNVITRIASCYVDAEKNIKMTSNESFYILTEDDAFKYEEIFKKTLSGTVGKGLLNIGFPISAQAQGGAHDFLMKLRDSALEDEELLKSFYNQVIENFVCDENYYIILINIMYDIPVKTKDKMLLDDASDEIYHALLCSICPVRLLKSALVYNSIRQHIENRAGDWKIEAPVNGFLFPVFNDRTTDIHEALYFSKNPAEINKKFLENILGVEAPFNAKEQKEIIQQELVKAIGNDCNYEIISRIHEEIGELIEANAADPNPLILEKNDMLNVMSKSGAADEAISMYRDSENTDISVPAENIIDSGRLDVKTSGISIKVENSDMYRLKTMDINGRKCLVIEVDDCIEVNGIPVKG